MSSPVYLSILIPVYNWDVAPLLMQLHEQCLQLSADERVEIIVIDDGSSEKYTNREMAAQLSLVSYNEAETNRGRSATRNALLSKAKGEYILFLDADMLPDQDDFVQTYIEQSQDGSEILCGGISYQKNTRNHPEYSFYLYKSQKTEALPAAVRNTAPWRYLFTSNIMVRRDIVETVCFDPDFTGYGFEDIEWGIRLGRVHALRHIENTCTHMGVMTKEQVFAKMRESIPNYALLLARHPEETGSSGAAGVARLLRHLPELFLTTSDQMLGFLFFRFSWNPLLLNIFQVDKAVLLAGILKKQSPGTAE